MPFPHLLQAMDPQPPAEVLAAADGLTFRDFLTVALVVPEEDGFPDNWIYIHEPDGRGRPHPELRLVVALPGEGRAHLPRPRVLRVRGRRAVEQGRRRPRRARRADELARLNLVGADKVEAGYVVRMPKAYPVYDEDYTDNIAVLRKWLEANAPNVHPVGRNGMHRYNNQDHSMLTAMLTVENILDRCRPRRLGGQRRRRVPRGEGLLGFRLVVLVVDQRGRRHRPLRPRHPSTQQLTRQGRCRP